ncbi:MAG: hypothetical protein MZV70_41050 [Desulfobacterales bacterium]|nr:hypothetical protein [Desulfobacterales bacterium]
MRHISVSSSSTARVLELLRPVRGLAVILTLRQPGAGGHPVPGPHPVRQGDRPAHQRRRARGRGDLPRRRADLRPVGGGGGGRHRRRASWCRCTPTGWPTASA